MARKVSHRPYLEGLEVVDEDVGHPEVVDEVQVDRVQLLPVRGPATEGMRVCRDDGDRGWILLFVSAQVSHAGSVDGRTYFLTLQTLKVVHSLQACSWLDVGGKLTLFSEAYQCSMGLLVPQQLEPQFLLSNTVNFTT